MVTKPKEEGLKPTPNNRPRTPKNTCECIRGLIVDPTRPVKSYSSIGLGHLQSPKSLTIKLSRKRNLNQKDQPLDWKTLCQIVNEFYSTGWNSGKRPNSEVLKSAVQSEYSTFF